MATISFRIDDDDRDALEELARGRGASVSELLRHSIDVLLGREVEMKRQDAPQSLTMVERQILANQHQILARIDKDEASYHKKRSELLEGGYAAEYEDEFNAIEPELSRQECELVWDILDMFMTLKASMARLSKAELKRVDERADLKFKFDGFDFSHPLESRLLAYTRYLVDDERWEDVVEGWTDNGNSHRPKLDVYRRMLEAYKPILESKRSKRGFMFDDLLLNPAELRAVAEATIHPSNRNRKL